MPRYIALMTWTDHGLADLSQAFQFVPRAEQELRANGATLADIYSTSGEYDLIAILAAPDEYAVEKSVRVLEFIGKVRITALRAFGRDEFERIALRG